MTDQTQQTSLIPLPIQQRLGEINMEIINEIEIAEEFQITDDESAKLAGEQLQSISKLIRRFTDERMGHTRQLDSVKSAIMSGYAGPVSKLEAGSLALRQRLTKWLDRREAERQAQIRAEQDRIERERREAEAALAREQERAAALKTDAARARAETRIEDAAAKVEEAQVSAPVVAAAAKVKGFGVRKELVADYEASDMQALIAAAASNQKLARYLQPNTVEINKMVKAMQASVTDVIPGLKLVERTITTSR